MDLQISVFLLFVLLAAGHSLSCYECQTGSCEEIKCSNGFNCISATFVAVSPYNTSVTKVKRCIPTSECISGSINLGDEKMSSYCCTTDLCNALDSPVPSNFPNGKTCYYCDGQSCSNILSCSGSEDRCLTATRSFRGQSVVVKGCVSKSVCYAATFIPNVQGFSCCKGNLCNTAQSVTKSFLFLCCSLLSFILLH